MHITFTMHMLRASCGPAVGRVEVVGGDLLPLLLGALQRGDVEELLEGRLGARDLRDLIRLGLRGFRARPRRRRRRRPLGLRALRPRPRLGDEGRRVHVADGEAARGEAAAGVHDGLLYIERGYIYIYIYIYMYSIGENMGSYYTYYVCICIYI